MKLSKERQQLVADNERLIYYVCNKYNINVNEFYGDLAIGLCKAAYHYKDIGFKFSTFAITCMINEYRLALKRTKSTSHIPSNIIYSLDYVICKEENISICDTIAGKRDVFDDLVFIDFPDLSNFETTVLYLYVTGYTQVDISTKLGTCQSHICRTLKNIKNKLVERM